MGIWAKITDIRVKFISANIRKSGKNSYAGYEYFELADILPVALPMMKEIGLCEAISFNNEMATMTVVDTETGETALFTSPMASISLKGCHEIQNVGAVETYQRRYLWNAFLEVVEADTLDATTGKDDNSPKALPPKKNQNDAKIMGEPDYSARNVWSQLMLFFGYEPTAQDSDKSKKAKEQSLTFIKPYGFVSGKDITPEAGKAILERIERMKANAKKDEEAIDEP